MKRICKDYKHKFKAVHFPLASLKGISDREDVRITTYKEEYLIHLVDVIHPAKSILSISDSEYSIIPKETKKKPRKTKEAKVFAIPDFSADKDARHVFLVQSSKVEARITRGTNTQILASCDKFNSMTFYRSNAFMRFLKR